MEVDYFTPYGAYADDAIGPLPTFPVPVSYPMAATMALLPLQPPLYETQVLDPPRPAPPRPAPPRPAPPCPALPCHAVVSRFVQDPNPLESWLTDPSKHTKGHWYMLCCPDGSYGLAASAAFASHVFTHPEGAQPVCILQVLVAGGSSEYCANSMTPAGSTSWLLDVTPGANHSLVVEELTYPRVVTITLTTLLHHHIIVS